MTVDVGKSSFFMFSYAKQCQKLWTVVKSLRFLTRNTYYGKQKYEQGEWEGEAISYTGLTWRGIRIKYYVCTGQ